MLAPEVTLAALVSVQTALWKALSCLALSWILDGRAPLAIDAAGGHMRWHATRFFCALPIHVFHHRQCPDHATEVLADSDLKEGTVSVDSVKNLNVSWLVVEPEEHARLTGNERLSEAHLDEMEAPVKEGVGFIVKVIEHLYPHVLIWDAYCKHVLLWIYINVWTIQN